MNTKDTNPKDLIGSTKPSLSCIPCPVLFELGAAMLEGTKYGRHNYREMGVRSSVYYDAAMRHIMDWWEGENIDPDSGLPHLAKAMACLAILRDGAIQGNLNDDRPPRSPKEWLRVSQMNTTKVLENLEGKVLPPYTQVRKDKEESE